VPGGPARAVPDPAAYRRLVADAERRSQQGQRAQALGLYQKALVAQPGGLDALTGLGYTTLDLGRRREAISWFRQALRRAPGHGDAQIGLAEALKGDGKIAQALSAYRGYLATHPSGRDAGMARRNVEDLAARRRQLRRPDPRFDPLSQRSRLRLPAPRRRRWSSQASGSADQAAVPGAVAGGVPSWQPTEPGTASSAADPDSASPFGARG
jgi:tetratricopeptide (TPR) repeat protein